MNYSKTSMAALVAVLIGTPALSATMINLEFEGSAELAPILPDQFVLSRNFGKNTDFLEIREKVTVEPGQFEAMVNPTLEAEFDAFMSLSSAGSATVSLNLADLTSRHVSRAGVNYQSTGFFRWNRIESPLPESLEFLAPDIAGGSTSASILNETREVVAVGQAGFPGFPSVDLDGTPVDAVGVNGFEIFPPIIVPKGPPGFAPKAGVTNGYGLFSDLELSGLTGSLTATNQLTGTVKSIDFLLSGGTLDLNLDLSEVGTWDLELSNLGLNNQITSTLTNVVTRTLGFAIEFPLSDLLFGEGCGNPTKDSDNGNLCAFDTGKAWSTSSDLYKDQISTADFFLSQAITSFGSITVGTDGPGGGSGLTPVPLPAGLPLYFAALGGLALIQRQRKPRSE